MPLQGTINTPNPNPSTAEWSNSTTAVLAPDGTTLLTAGSAAAASRLAFLLNFLTALASRTPS